MKIRLTFSPTARDAIGSRNSAGAFASTVIMIFPSGIGTEEELSVTDSTTAVMVVPIFISPSTEPRITSIPCVVLRVSEEKSLVIM